MTDAEIEKLEQGEEDTPEEVVEELEDDAETVEEDEGDEVQPLPPAAPKGPQTVPYERFQEQVQETAKLKGMLEQLSQVVQQTRAPTVQKASYVKPNDTPDKKQWREFVGETVDDVITSRLAEIEEQNKQRALALAEQQDDQKARTMFEDYGEYEADIDALRGNFYRGTGVAVPREYAYYVAKATRERKKGVGQVRRAAVKRASAAAAGEARPPMKGSKRAELMTADRVSKMSLKEMEEYLGKKNARV